MDDCAGQFYQTSRPAPGGRRGKEANAILFQSRIHSTFDGLFRSLINYQIIQDTGIKIGEEPAYTFVKDVKNHLEEIDSTVSSDVQTQEALKQKELNRLLVDVQALLTDKNMTGAAEQLRVATALAPENDQVLKLIDRLKMMEEAQKALEAGSLYAAQHYDEALQAYTQFSEIAGSELLTADPTE